MKKLSVGLLILIIGIGVGYALVEIPAWSGSVSIYESNGADFADSNKLDGNFLVSKQEGIGYLLETVFTKEDLYCPDKDNPGRLDDNPCYLPVNCNRSSGSLEVISCN